MKLIEIYTQPWCRSAPAPSTCFDSKGVAYTEIEAPHGTAKRARGGRRSGGRNTVPQIFIDGAHIGGCDELLALERAGKLDPLLAVA